MVAFDSWHHRMMDRSHGGGMMDGGQMNGGGGWVVVLLVLLLLTVLACAVVYVLVTATTHVTPAVRGPSPTPRSSREVLDRRLAHGDITPEEYGARRQLLDL